jgi:hypothetical protein
MPRPDFDRTYRSLFLRLALPFSLNLCAPESNSENLSWYRRPAPPAEVWASVGLPRLPVSLPPCLSPPLGTQQGEEKAKV